MAHKIDYPVLTIDEFIRSVSVNKKTPHALFIGAGASKTSGVPTADSCIWDWKRQIYLSQNPGVEGLFKEITLGSVRSRLQKWLDDERKWPEVGSPEEYSTYIEKCFPLANDRKRYFQELSSQSVPYIGYRLLNLLVQFGLFKIIWSTNFDGMTIKALRDTSINIIECSPDTKERVSRPPHPNELLHIALHGDYRYDDLKNTTQELQDQDKDLREDLVRRLYDTNLIVCGYSGRDESVMESLRAAYSKPGPGRLFWCGMFRHQPLESVRELLNLARQNGREAFYVESDGFDDVMRRIALSSFDKEYFDSAQEIIESQSTEIKTKPFHLDLGENLEILRSNSFQLDCPSSLWQFSAKNLATTRRWKHVQDIIQDYEIVAAPFKNEILAIGNLAMIKQAFADFIEGDIISGVITQNDISREKGVIIEMLTQAITRSLSKGTQLNTDKRRLLWEKSLSSQKTISKISCYIHDAAVLSIKRYGNQQFLSITPTIIVYNSSGDRVPKEIEKEAKRQILGYQRNKEYTSQINKWRQRLFPTNKPFYFPEGETDGSQFKVNNRNVLALIHSPVQDSPKSQQERLTLSSNITGLVKYHGTRIAEPKLVFTSKFGDNLTYDAYPLRGIANNRPYDYALTQKHLNDSIKIGLISPKQDASHIQTFLQNLNHPCQPGANQEYVLPYPGFSAAFGTTLELPQAEIQCGYYNVPTNSGNRLADANEMRRSITNAITNLQRKDDINVIIIYVPDYCESFTSVDYEGGRFDLRRTVKGFCIEQGIATQFIRNKTISGSPEMKCQTLWWLALALYVKAGRTPWILANQDKGTAFAGLGFSLEQHAKTNKNFTIGCSHIYNTQGIDLKYKLSGLENVSWRRENPFLSREDGRRVGEGIREVFYEATKKLPNRVVIHKRTPFGNDEKKGILDALQDVEIVDLLEVTTEPSLRFLTNRIIDGGKLHSDNFPVSRDTVLQLDSHRALLWIHGTVPSVKGSRNYYMGGYRIPAPLIVRREHGSTPLMTLAHEILGLSKMNWNTFNMYTKTPATIQSSNDIARIGALLSRFGFKSYDYRLFM